MRQSLYTVPGSQIPSREPTRAMGPTFLRGTRGGPGLLEEAIYGHPRIESGVRELRDAVSEADIVVRNAPESDVAEAAFAAACRRVISTLRTSEDEHTSSRDALAELSDALVRGACVWEGVWHEDASHPEWPYRLELAHIPLSSIRSWEVGDDGSIVEVTQSTDRGSVKIPGSRLIHVDPSGGQYGPEGLSVLRPIVFLFQIWKQIVLAAGRRADNESGSLVATQPLGVDEAAASAIVGTLSALAEGSVAVASVPPGWDVTALQLAPASDLVARLQYIDAQIDAQLNRVLNSLGYSAHGSRALGEAVAVEQDWAHDRRLSSLVSLFGRRLFGWLAGELDHRGRIPTLSLDVAAEMDPLDRIEVAERAAPLVGWSQSDADSLREDVGLSRSHSRSCGCGSCGSVSLARRGADWRPRREPEGLERAVDWVGINLSRVRDEDWLAREVGATAAQLRSDALDELRAGPLSNQDRSALLGLYADRLRLIINKFLAARRGAIAAQVPEEARRSRDMGLITLAEVSAANVTAVVANAVDQITRSVEESAAVAAWEIASRVLGEAEAQVAAQSGDRATSVEAARAEGTSITTDGLIEPVAADGRRAEQGARVAAAADSGLRIVRLVRTNIEDDNVCDWCESQGGAVIDLDIPGTSVPMLPDEQCEGTARRCRCGWIVEYGQ